MIYSNLIEKKIEMIDFSSENNKINGLIAKIIAKKNSIL